MIRLEHNNTINLVLWDFFNGLIFILNKTCYIFSSDKDEMEPDAEAVTSMLGLQSYWDSQYADELTNFREHGHVGEVWYVRIA